MAINYLYNFVVGTSHLINKNIIVNYLVRIGEKVENLFQVTLMVYPIKSILWFKRMNHNGSVSHTLKKEPCISMHNPPSPQTFPHFVVYNIEAGVKIDIVCKTLSK